MRFPEFDVIMNLEMISMSILACRRAIFRVSKLIELFNRFQMILKKKSFVMSRFRIGSFKENYGTHLNTEFLRFYNRLF